MQLILDWCTEEIVDLAKDEAERKKTRVEMELARPLLKKVLAAVAEWVEETVGPVLKAEANGDDSADEKLFRLFNSLQGSPNSDDLLDLIANWDFEEKSEKEEL